MINLVFISNITLQYHIQHSENEKALLDIKKWYKAFSCIIIKNYTKEKCEKTTKTLIPYKIIWTTPLLLKKYTANNNRGHKKLFYDVSHYFILLFL